MSGTPQKIAYLVVVALALATAAPAPALPEGQSESGVMSNQTENVSSVAPTIKCSTNGDSIHNLSTLFFGHLTVVKYLEVIIQYYYCM